MRTSLFTTLAACAAFCVFSSLASAGGQITPVQKRTKSAAPIAIRTVSKPSCAPLAHRRAGAPIRAEKRAPSPAPDEKSHRKAAEDLLLAVNVDKAMQSTIDQMLDLQIKQHPEIAPYRNVMKRFFSKYLSYASLKEELITAYTQEFTEAELNQITAFYKTPVGQKAVEKMPKLFAKGAQIGMAQVQAHQAELEQMLREEENKQRKPQ